MQSWRKALSEDPGEKNPNPGGGKNPNPGGGSRKNPFRRAQSEPAGSLLAALSPSAQPNPAAPGPPPNAEASGGGPPPDPAQKGGGGALIKKYLMTVTQKLKRPRLVSRSSTPSLLPDVEEADPAGPSELGGPHWVSPQEVPLWDISSCSLSEGQILISQEDEPTTWIRNRVSSCLSNPSMQNLVDIDAECSPDPVGPPGAARPKSQDGGVRGLIKRRLDKAKRNSASHLTPMGLNKGSRHYSSRDSLSIPVGAVGTLDLSSDTSTVIRPVHSSILGEKYCFEVISSENTHCFGCTSLAERDRWIEDLRRAAQPNKDNVERTENSLSLWVNEAKDLPPKRRFYCELHLDRTLFARTSSRPPRPPPSGDAPSAPPHHAVAGSNPPAGCQLFWGELFELDNLPSVSQISLHLFREEDPKKRRHSREESGLLPLGSVVIPVADVQGRGYQERWYPIAPYRPAGGSAPKDPLGPQASLRIRARFQNLRVLPMERYKEFAEYVTRDYVDMCGSLEPLLAVKEKEELAGALVHVLQSIGKAKEKEELAGALVHVLQSIGKAKEFLIDLGGAEVERLGEKEALIFRENTLATKAIDEYMKLVGQKYLIDTLGDFITRLYASGESCEVDPRKCPPAELSSSQTHLRDTCEEVVQKIIHIHGPFPEELVGIFSSWVGVCGGRLDVGHRLISASLFLRFLCPAVLSPSLFGLAQAYPEPPTLRTLTLTAKVIQNLANFTLFGEKEEYMLFMNEFLEQHWDGMRSFLQTVSSQDAEIPTSSFDGYVDLPLRLAVLHGLLVDIIHKKDQDTIEKLHPLPSILNQITESLGPEAPRIPITSHTGQSKPDYVPPRDLSKYSPLQTSLQQLPVDPKALRESDGRKTGKLLKRTHSAPHPGKKKALRRQMSSEALATPDQPPKPDPSQPLISPPNPIPGDKRVQAQVPWIEVSTHSEVKAEDQQLNLLDRHALELAELRVGIDQVTERELDMAKRLEDFISQSQDQNALLQAEVGELRTLLAVREEQLASAHFRLGVIEEEREEEERRLSVAVAAAERMNVLEEQFAGLVRDLQQLSDACKSIQNNTQHPEKPLLNST